MQLRAVEPILALSALLLVTGCSTSVATTSTGGATTSSSSSGAGAGGSSPTTSSSSSGAGGGSFDAGGALTTYTTGIGPIMLGPGVEEVNCITIPLGNAEGGFVRRFRANLSEGSHHMIVYTTNDPENATPTPCQSLGGILDGEHPVFIAQQPMAELVFPNDENNVPVGFEIAPNQMLRIEFHTINTTQATLMVTGTAYMDAIPLSTTVTQSNIAFWGTENINIPAYSTFQTPVDFQAALPGTKSFAVTTHQHHLGTEMKIWYGSGATDTTDVVADGTNWANPPLVMLDPPLSYAAGSGMGLSYQCTWNNTTASAVTFGESFNDEMCFLWHYYYPSQGFQICSEGLCKITK